MVSGRHPEPERHFEQHGPHFVVTLWRDWLTQTVIKNLRLNDRQQQAVEYVKRNGRITNSEYQEISALPEKPLHGTSMDW